MGRDIDRRGYFHQAQRQGGGSVLGALDQTLNIMGQKLGQAPNSATRHRGDSPGYLPHWLD